MAERAHSLLIQETAALAGMHVQPSEGRRLTRLDRHALIRAYGEQQEAAYRAAKERAS